MQIPIAMQGPVGVRQTWPAFPAQSDKDVGEEVGNKVGELVGVEVGTLVGASVGGGAV